MSSGTTLYPRSAFAVLAAVVIKLWFTYGGACGCYWRPDFFGSPRNGLKNGMRGRSFVHFDVWGGPRRSKVVPGVGFCRKSRENWAENLQPNCLQVPSQSTLDQWCGRALRANRPSMGPIPGLPTLTGNRPGTIREPSCYFIYIYIYPRSLNSASLKLGIIELPGSTGRGPGVDFCVALYS